MYEIKINYVIAIQEYNFTKNFVLALSHFYTHEGLSIKSVVIFY